jgi:hypothetical protein
LIPKQDVGLATLVNQTYINLVSCVLAHTFEFSVSRSRSSPHNLLPWAPLGRFVGLKHRQAVTPLASKLRPPREGRRAPTVAPQAGASRSPRRAASGRHLSRAPLRSPHFGAPDGKSETCPRCLTAPHRVAATGELSRGAHAPTFPVGNQGNSPPRPVPRLTTSRRWSAVPRHRSHRGGHNPRL